MLICHCLCVFDRDIRQAVREGAETVEEVGDACGAGAGCGGCRSAVAEIIEVERGSCPRIAVVHAVEPAPTAVAHLVSLRIVRQAS